MPRVHVRLRAHTLHAAYAMMQALTLLHLVFESEDTEDLVTGAQIVGQLVVVYARYARTTPNSNNRLRSLNACFQRFSDQQCLEMFRFDHDGLNELVQHLGIPECVSIPCAHLRPNGSREETAINTTRDELILIMLRRMTYPSRWCELEMELGLSEASLSRCFDWTIQFLTNKYGHGLEDPSRWYEYAGEWANAVYQASGHIVHNIIGMLDGTCRKMRRPTNSEADAGVDVQREFYSGHHRVHCLKFQTVTAACGLIIHLFGPINGRRHDGYLLRKSNLMAHVERLTDLAGLHYIVFGDSAYPTNEFMCHMNKGSGLSDPQIAFNNTMSKYRVTVEWGYRDIIEQFAFVDFEKNLKLFLQPISSYFKVAALLTNCRTCMPTSNHTNRTACHFNCLPPMDLRTYLRTLEQ